MTIPAKHKFVALDSVRGIAALLVALVHLTADGYFYDFPPIRHGGLAVPLFFVLSGFVIAHTYGGRIRSGSDTKSFAIRRFGRLYPLHLFTLTLLVGLEIAKLALVQAGVSSGQPPFSGTNSFGALAAHLLFLQAIIPFGDYTWNGPSWSLSTEFYTYFVFAAVAFAMARRKLRIDPVPVIWALSGVLLAWGEAVDLPWHNAAGKGIVSCIFGFFTGWLTYRLFLRLQEPGMQRFRSFLGLAEVLAVLSGIAVFWFGAESATAPAILVFAAMVLFLAFDHGPVATLINRPLFQTLGQLSYSIYLVHFVLLNVLTGVLRAADSVLGMDLILSETAMIDFGPKIAMDLLALAYLAVMLGVSSLTFRYVEEPGRRFFGAIASGRQPWQRKPDTEAARN